MQTLAHACTPRDSIFDLSRRDTVLDLSDLVADRIDPEPFFRGAARKLAPPCGFGQA
jgi:hypothetical protein